MSVDARHRDRRQAQRNRKPTPNLVRLRFDFAARRFKGFAADRSAGYRRQAARLRHASDVSALVTEARKFSLNTPMFPAIGNSTPHSWEIAFRSSRCFDTPHDREYTFRENTNEVMNEK